jgi:hypothetical protein
VHRLLDDVVAGQPGSTASCDLVFSCSTRRRPSATGLRIVVQPDDVADLAVGRA